MNSASTRRKVVLVPYHIVLNLLCSNNSQVCTAPVAQGLPTTAIVRSVFNDEMRAAFAFVIEDASFDEVPEGTKAPEIKVEWICIDLHERIRALAEKRSLDLQTDV